MKKKQPSVKGKYLMVPVILAFAFGLFSCSLLKNSTREVNKYIRVDSLNNKTIVVKMGYDAVSAISTQSGIVVIDAGISKALSRKYRKIIKKKLGRHDFSYMINTHAHSDHSGGNSAFSDAILVGHENCKTEIENYNHNIGKKIKWTEAVVIEYQKALDTLSRDSEDWKEAFCQSMRYRNAYRDVRRGTVIPEPTVTFTDSLRISTGDVTLDLYYFGAAHSANDILIHIPEMKILFTGDLITKWGRPSFDAENHEKRLAWKKSVQWMLNRLDEIETVVSGHGEKMTRPDLEYFISQLKM